jgi:chromosome segregation ATPase
LDILEQLEHKVLGTVSALEDARQQRRTLEDQIEALKQQLATTEERLQHRDTAITALQQQYEAAKKENTRLAQEKSEWEVKVSALMELIEQCEPA